MYLKDKSQSQPSALLIMSSEQIAAEYRALYRHMLTLPADVRWTRGAELKRLKAAWQAAQESEQVRTR